MLLCSLAVISFTNFLTHLSVLSDLADWLGVGEIGLFNFKPSVRPVPLEVHIQVSGGSILHALWFFQHQLAFISTLIFIFYCCIVLIILLNEDRCQLLSLF